jgi:molybdate/tungstate transport system permease protein
MNIFNIPGRSGFLKSDIFVLFLYLVSVTFVFTSDTGSMIVMCIAHFFALFIYASVIRRMDLFKRVLFLLYLIILAFIELQVIGEMLLYVIFVFVLTASYPFKVIRRISISLILAVSFAPYYYISLTLMSTFFILINSNQSLKQEDTFDKLIFYFAHVSLFIIVLPLFYLLFQNTFQTLYLTLIDDKFQTAVFNSLFTSICSSVIILIAGLPVAYSLVKFKFAFKNFIDTLIDLPILIPQSVIGIALLFLLGPKAPLGLLFSKIGISFYGTYYGIITAQVVVAFPFFIRSVTNALSKIPYEYDVISKSLGASSYETFKRVTLPLILPAVFDGFLLSFARAISEFGALVIMAYEPYTLPVYAYDILLRYGLAESQPVAVIFLIMAIWVFFLLRYFRLKIEIKNRGYNE